MFAVRDAAGYDPEVVQVPPNATGHETREEAVAAWRARLRREAEVHEEAALALRRLAEQTPRGA